ncbi:MAG TPA: Stealth CR1 domain-containing protein [Pilimelia sp.]|nr:Stealth CR1 domain-containing protein [Pilimelia sp.]
MKITFLLTWADAVGGTERTVLRQASWLAERHDVEVISVFKSRRELPFRVSPRVTLRYLVDQTGPVPRPVRGGLSDDVCSALAATPSRWVRPEWESAFTVLADLELENALREIRTDVVVATTPALLAVVAQLVPRDVATVCQEHRVSELRGSSAEPLRLFTPRLDGMVLLSEPTRAWFAEWLGPAAPRLEVIPNALEDGYQPTSTRQTDTIVWAGRMTPEKQVGHAIAAFAQLAADFPTWRLRIFGGGELARATRAVERFSLGDRVEVMGESPTLGYEWSKASIALLTSRNEAFPLVIGEAMVAGVPVVAYDCPNGPAELIRDGETGFLVAPNNVTDLAAALRKLVEDPALRHRMGEAAARRAELFTTDRVMPRWEEFYAELLRGRGEPDWPDRRRAAIAAAARPVRPEHRDRPAQLPRLPEVDVEAWAAGLEARRPDLLWTRGQLTVVQEQATPAGVAQANLDLVVDALEQAGVEYFVLRDPGPVHRVAVREEHRAAVLRALAARYPDRPVYVEPFLPTKRTGGVWPAVAAPAAEVTSRAAWLRVFEPVITPSQTLRYGTASGCAVEFWSTSAEGDELVAPNPTIWGDRLPVAALTPAHTEVNGRPYRSVAPFGKKLVSEVDFPIDIVYTWVDGADPAWLARRAAVLGTGGRELDQDAIAAARYRSRDELRHSLRSLELFAPWVRRIWIVTDRQRPGWLDPDHPRVRVVDHTEIFTDPAALPTFNSHAIESQLHHIDGLAEHFLYFNDDVFLGRPIPPDLFFTPGGLPKVFPSPTTVPPLPLQEGDEGFLAAAKRNRALLEERFGRTLVHTFLHAPHAHRRSTLSRIEAEFPEAIDTTMRSPARSATDVALLSSFAQYYGLLTGTAVVGTLRCAFVNVGLREQHARLYDLLAQRGHEVFCLNDFHDSAVDPTEQHQVISTFLGAYFPIASQFELDRPVGGGSPAQAGAAPAGGTR